MTGGGRCSGRGSCGIVPAIADELAAAERDRTIVPVLTSRSPGTVVEDSCAVQNTWRRRALGAGRRAVGRKVGPTSKGVQAATGIDAPGHETVFAGMLFGTGSVVGHARCSAAHRGRARLRARGRRRGAAGTRLRVAAAHVPATGGGARPSC